MKRIKYYIVSSTLLLSAIFASCGDFLDKAPDNRAEVDTKQKITKLLVSAYSDQSWWLVAELSSDNADDNGSAWTVGSDLERQAFQWADATEKEQDSPQEIWDGHYKAIAASNVALDAIKKLELAGDKSLGAQKAEALICRAYNHFILVNIFSKAYGHTSDKDLGIPYMEKSETTVNPQYERGTVAEVYEKINKDIEEALPLINNGIYSVANYHFNRKAAYAFAARFNLFYRNYDKVIQYANQVLGANPVSALHDWKAGGLLSNNDNYRPDWYIGAGNAASLLNISAYSTWPYVHGPYSVGCRYTHNSTISTAETLSSSGPWGSANVFYFNKANYTPNLPKEVSRKYAAYFEYTDPVAQIGYIHIIQTVFSTDETLLCRAEAYALKKDYDNAAADLTSFMTAYSSVGSRMTRMNINQYYAGLAYYTPKVPTPKKALNPDFTIDPGEQENFIHCILHLRRILTMHEGLRWFDVKRYGIEVYRRKSENGIITVYQDKLVVNDERRAIQIPQDVINAGLQANPR